MGPADENSEDIEAVADEVEGEVADSSEEPATAPVKLTVEASSNVDSAPPKPVVAATPNADSDAEADADADAGEHDEGHREQLTEGEDDPLAPAYDLDDGELMDEDDEERAQLPWSSRVEQARDFFNGELLYRFDLLEPGQREFLRGAYRIEIRGNQGGVWTFTVGDELTIVNRREEAETVLSCYQRDFLQIVNGEINPQLAILAQKMRITGDLNRGISVQSLLSPQTE